MTTPRVRRAGDEVEDYCRACKLDRMHTVVVVDQTGQPLRVTCGYCRSEHNYRGGARTEPPAPPAARVRPDDRDAFPLVLERERKGTGMAMSTGVDDLEMLLRRVIREESGLSSVVPADRWRGGTLVLKPGASGLQEKTWPIETFFHKIVMLRNRLRTLEQQVNGSDLPEDAKVKLQTYVTGCYGSLTSFNVLFADEDDQFKGTGE